MLLTKTVKVKWNPKIKQHYVEKGYSFSKMKDEFEVKVEDLTDGSNLKVNVKCDKCEKILTNICWQSYKMNVKIDNCYYCVKCSHILYSEPNRLKTILKKSKSFEQWCIENNRQDILDRWDYELNKCSPKDICYGSEGFNRKGYWFKCVRGLHISELKNIKNLIYNESDLKCSKCNSFAQWGIDNLTEDFLDKYWDNEKNIVDPWEVSRNNEIKVWIKCQEKDYHGSYEIDCNGFTRGVRCCYCGNFKVHKLDSLGVLHPESLKHWSDKNKKSPYEYSPRSMKKVWWKCLKGKHDDFKRNIYASNIYNFRCPECQFSKGETKIDEYLIENKVFRIPQKEFVGLLGVKNRNLSYDFYLPQYNLLIEYQGEFHDGNGNYYIKQNLKKQIEHDIRKRKYAKDNNIKLLEIWYYDFEKIEEILEKELML